jgi:hypothetical protein
MANILLHSQLGSHSAAINTRALLESWGHTVSIIVTITSSTNFADRDLVMAVRPNDTVGVANAFLAALAQGKPVFVSPLSAGYTNENSLSSLPTRMGLMGPVAQSSDYWSTIRVEQHQITSLMHPSGAPITPDGTSTFGAAPTLDSLPAGAKRLTRIHTNPYNAVLASRPDLVIYERGLVTSQGTPLGAKAASAAFLYGGGVGYGVAAQSVIKRTVDWLLLPPDQTRQVIRATASGRIRKPASATTVSVQPARASARSVPARFGSGTGVLVTPASSQATAVTPAAVARNIVHVQPAQARARGSLVHNDNLPTRSLSMWAAGVELNLTSPNLHVDVDLF